MTYPEYQADLQRIHESEVYGMAVFGTAAALSLRAARKKKWQALHALEQQTLERYQAHMRATKQPLTPPHGWRLKGVVEGAALALLPWRAAMTLLRDGTQPFQQKFLRLKQHADAPQQAFFNYVYAHEKAIEAFASKELAREPDSLKPVEALLAP